MSMQEIIARLIEQSSLGGPGGEGRRFGGAGGEILDDLDSNDDGRQLSGLLRLCDELNMATPLTLASMNPDFFVPSILRCLQKESNLEVMLLAARALTYMADSIPRTLDTLSTHENIAVVLHHLRSIQDVELSEQCLTCVEKLSENSTAADVLLHEDGVTALLSFVDFFTISSQRKVWVTAARVCERVNPSSYQFAQSNLPAIRQATRSDDAKIRERALMALVYIINGMQSNAARVDEVFADMIDVLQSIVAKPDNSDPTFSAALSLISSGVAYSDKVIEKLIRSGLVHGLFALLDTTVSLPPSQLSPLAASPVGSPNITAADPPPSPPHSPAHSPQQSPPTSLRLRPAEAPSRPRLNIEHIKMVCGALAAMLVVNREGYLGYVEYLKLLEHKVPATPSMMDNEEEEALDTDSEATADDDGSREEESLGVLRGLIEKTGVKLSTKRRYASCRVGAHTCDVCGSRCTPGNWYRCNDCSDVDYCAACLHVIWHEHQNGQHTFTDMLDVFPPRGVNSGPPSKLEKAKVLLYERSPELLATMLKAIPNVVRLCVESESIAIRSLGLSFLCRGLYMATPAQLAESGIKDTAISETITTALSDGSLLLNLTGIFLTGELVTKLPSVYHSLLVREGVTHLLLSAKQRYTSEEGQAKVKQQLPLERRVLTLAGWSDILSNEISSILSKFPSLQDKVRLENLNRIARLLRANRLPRAFDALRDAILDDTTSFEITSSDVLHELKEALVRGNDVASVLRLVRTLNDTPPTEAGVDTAPALLRFVRHLQTILSHLDQFQPPSFGPITSIRSRLPLRIVPHKPSSSYASGSAESGRASQRQAPTTDDEISSASGRSATVSIEPLANVGAVSAFICNQLLASSTFGELGRRGSQGADSDDDRVEDVLPELADDTAQRQVTDKPRRKRVGGNDRRQSMWIRCGSYVLPTSMTILQVLQRITTKKSGKKSKRSSNSVDTLSRGSRISAVEPLTLYYSSVPYGPEYSMLSCATDVPMCDPTVDPVVHLPSQEARPPAVLAVLEQLHSPFLFSKSYLTAAQMDILVLLGTLHETIKHWRELRWFVDGEALNEQEEDACPPAIGLSEFQHHKLNNKAMRHCSNLLLAGQHLSTWAVNLALDCNFLFALSTRKYLFEVSFCGTVRSLVRMQQLLEEYGIRDRSAGDVDSARAFRLQRAKKRVWRKKPLECAMHVVANPNSSGSVVWEFEFYGEEGSGLGPTREFYTLVAAALRERGLNLWRSSGETEEDKYFLPLNGLYPRPLPPQSSEEDRLVEYFSFIGRFLARAILDERVPALALSPVLLKMLRGDPCGLYDVQSISDSLGQVVMAIAAAAQSHTDLITLPGQKKGYPIETMELDFTLPGDDQVELIPDGASIAVSGANMAQYCDEVVRFMLKTGVERVVKALRAGFHDYIPLCALRMLSVEEFYEVINGHEQAVTQEELENNCLADHGFTITSRPVQWLFEIVSGFTVEEQRTFFLFLTGSPHLPVGGLPSLRPKITVVRKTSTDPAVQETDQLPSAMTCQNYLKLPAYESKEQMEQKLRQAMDEGGNVFLLT